MATGSILSTARRNTMSAMPMPVAFPSVSSVRSRTIMRWIRGVTGSSVGGRTPATSRLITFGIRAIAGDVFADAVDDQDVDPLSGQATHPLPRDLSSSCSRSQTRAAGTASAWARLP